MVSQLIHKAVSYLGVTEPTGDDLFIKYYNKITGAGFSMSVSWCAIYVAIIARMQNIPTSIIPTFADCDVGKLWFERKGRYEKSRSYGGSYLPKRGDVIFYSLKHKQSDATHVGYVVGVENGKIRTIEGNKNDKVAYRVIAPSDSYIIGYGRCAQFMESISTPPVEFNISVKAYQQWLNNTYSATIKNNCGTLLVIDNSYGVKTRNAGLCVWKYELNKKKVGYTFDLKNNNFGEMCLKYSNRILVKSGSTGAFVYLVQGMLCAKGYYYSNLDGNAGTLTENAIRAFQKSTKGKLVVDGVCGAKTYQALFG